MILRQQVSKFMNEENTNIDDAPKAVPSFSLPKASSPSASFMEDAAPTMSTQRPEDFSVAIAPQDMESPAMIAVDVIAAIMAISGLILYFIS